MAYEDLSDEDKVLEAIRFVARGVVMPDQLRAFLVEQGLYELIANPVEIEENANELDQGDSG